MVDLGCPVFLLSASLTAEMLKPSSALMGAGLGQDVALLTDGRFSGGSHGFLIGIQVFCSISDLQDILSRKLNQADPSR